MELETELLDRWWEGAAKIGLGKGTVRIRTLTTHPASQLPPLAPHSGDFVDIVGSVIAGSVAPPLAPPPVTSFKAKPNSSPSSSSAPLSFRHRPLNGVRPLSPKTRVRDPCRLERQTRPVAG
jgi:hypothetical protein